MPSLDRKRDVYSRLVFWIDYYLDGFVGDQHALLIAAVHFPAETGIPPVPCGVTNIPRGGLLGSRANYVAVAGTEVLSQHGPDADAAFRAARYGAYGIARDVIRDEMSRHRKDRVPFSPGHLQGSVRHYGTPLTELDPDGDSLEAVVHLPSGRSVSISVEHTSEELVNDWFPLPEHAKVGDWLVEYLPDWVPSEYVEILNRFDCVEHAREYANVQAMTLMVMYWILESAGRRDFPNGKFFTAAQAQATFDGMLEELRGRVRLP